MIEIKYIKVLYKGKYIKIKHHPYYKALKNHDHHYYEKIIGKSDNAQKIKETSTYHGLKKLIKKIKDYGFNITQDPIKINDLKVNHGRHRMCILYYLYKKKLSFELDSNNYIKNLV